MHDLVAKALGQSQVVLAVVAGGEAKELGLVVRGRLNRGVRMHDLVAHLGERQLLHVVRVAEGVVFDLDEVEPRQLLHVFEVGFDETAGDKDRERNALIQQIIEHRTVERDRLALFAGVECKRDDLFIGRQAGNHVGARDRWRHDRGRKRSDEPNPPHDPMHDAGQQVAQVLCTLHPLKNSRKCLGPFNPTTLVIPAKRSLPKAGAARAGTHRESRG